MAYCRLSDDCDVYLYHDGEKFVFTGKSPAVEWTCEHPVDALGHCASLLIDGHKVAFPAFTRLARETLATQGHATNEPSEDTAAPDTIVLAVPSSVVNPTAGEDEESAPLFIDQGWTELATYFGGTTGLSAEALEAAIEQDLRALPDTLDGTGDPLVINALAAWGSRLDAVGLDLVCAQREGGTLFELTPESRAAFERHALSATAREAHQEARRDRQESDLAEIERKRL